MASSSAAAPPMKRHPRVACGGAHSLIVTERTEVLGWGSNSHGQMGNGTLEDVLRPITIIERGAIGVFAGRYFSLLVNEGGELWAWGFNEDGILGIGSGVEKQQKPVQIDTGGRKIKHAAGGWKHVLAVTADGELLTWGNNEYGQLGDGTTEKRRKPGITALPGGAKAKEVAAGFYHSLVLTEAGEVLAAGMGYGSGSIECPAISRMAGRGGRFTQVIRAGIKQISAGGMHSLALTKTGTVLAWGSNDHGQVGNGTLEFQPTPVAVCSGQVVISAGGSHSMCADDNYQVKVWGHGVIPANDETPDCPARVSVCEPTDLDTPDGGFYVAAGEAHSLIGGPDGEVLAYGRNLGGQVGNGSLHDCGMPIEVLTAGTIEIVSQADRVEALMKAPTEDYGPAQAKPGMESSVDRGLAQLPMGPPSVTYKGHRGESGGVPDVLRRTAGVSLSQELVLHLPKSSVNALGGLRSKRMQLKNS